MTISTDSQTHFNLYIAIIFVLLLSFLEYRLVILLHADDLNQLIAAAYGITIGEPHWRVYQNRLLGPFSVKLMAEFFQMTYAHIYLFVMMGLLLIQNLLFFYLFYHLTSDKRLSLRYTFYFVACFVALQHTTWLYLWDYIDIIVFTLLIYGILRHHKTGFFGLVFVFAILNKESALFIALWLILDALIEKSEPHRFQLAFKLRDFKRLLFGIILLGGGICFVEWIREMLFIKSVAGSAQLTGIEYGKYIHFKLFLNLKTFVYNFYIPTFRLNFLISLLVLFLPLVALIKSKNAEDIIFKIILLFLAIYSTIILFGLLNETRVYNILIPFVIFLSAYFSGHLIPPKKV